MLYLKPTEAQREAAHQVNISTKNGVDRVLWRSIYVPIVSRKLVLLVVEKLTPSLLEEFEGLLSFSNATSLNAAIVVLFRHLVTDNGLAPFEAVLEIQTALSKVIQEEVLVPFKERFGHDLFPPLFAGYSAAHERKNARKKTFRAAISARPVRRFMAQNSPERARMEQLELLGNLAWAKAQLSANPAADVEQFMWEDFAQMMGDLRPVRNAIKRLPVLETEHEAETWLILCRFCEPVLLAAITFLLWNDDNTNAKLVRKWRKDAISHGEKALKAAQTRAAEIADFRDEMTQRGRNIRGGKKAVRSSVAVSFQTLKDTKTRWVVKSKVAKGKRYYAFSEFVTVDELLKECVAIAKAEGKHYSFVAYSCLSKCYFDVKVTYTYGQISPVKVDICPCGVEDSKTIRRPK